MDKYTLHSLFCSMAAFALLGASGSALNAQQEEGFRPVVEAIRETKPTSPTELIWAVRTLLQIDEAYEANQYMEKLIALSPDNETLVELHDEYGSAVFFSLGREPMLDEEGRQLAIDVLEAAYQAARSPERLHELVQDLGDDDSLVVYSAVADLRQAGSASIGPLLKALANDRQADLHEEARRALVELGLEAIEPLIAALHSPSEEVQRAAIEALGQLDAQRAKPYLIRPLIDEASSDAVRNAAESAFLLLSKSVPTAADAEIYLANRVSTYLEFYTPLTTDEVGNTKFWQWDSQAQTPAMQQVDARIASLAVAADLASDLHHLWPENDDYLRLFLGTNIALEKRTQGLGTPLDTAAGSVHALAASHGIDPIESLLVTAIQEDQIDAAIGAIEILGSIGDESLLDSRQGGPRPLAAALRHSDRRVRYFASRAIMQIDPQEAYVGSSYLPEVLTYFIGTSTDRRALIVHPRSSDAQSMAGLLNEIGYAPDVAVAGRGAMKQAIAQPDYAFILISDAIESPTTRELLAELRADFRTASIPIGVITRSHNIEQFQLLAEGDPMTKIFPRPHDVQGMTFQSQRLIELAEHHRVDEGERHMQALDALQWLEKLAAERNTYRFYNIFRQEDQIIAALHVPEIATQAAKLLGRLGTAKAQQELVTFASQHYRPLSHRAAAAEAFELAVQSRGVMLTRREIIHQYEVYNQSATQNRETQNVLGSLLDTIENRAEAAVNEAN